MAYRVDYPRDSRYEKQPRKSGFLRFLFRLLFFSLFLVLVSAFWQRGREVLLQLLFPGDWDATLNAAAAFASDLQSGLPLRFAVESFCREIIHSGY